MSTIQNNFTVKTSAEHVLPGHPDKLCDAIVDAIVDRLCSLDPGAQCGLEAAVVFNSVYLTGRLAANKRSLKKLNVEKLVRDTWRNAGYGTDAKGYIWGPTSEELQISTNFCFGEFVQGERELRRLSDDQAICVGYAIDRPETAYMPPAHWLARKIASRLYNLRIEKGAGNIGPDGKILVQIEENQSEWKPTTVSISLNHHESSDLLFLRQIAEQAVEESIGGKPMPKIVLNGAGNFVSGGPNGDNGLSGKKLVVDAYGPTVPIGGGAWSGKDFRKVDRLGGMLARELALRAVKEKLGRETLVRLVYFPGSDKPELMEILIDNVPIGSIGFLKKIGSPLIDNISVWNRYKTCSISLTDFARWGHQHPGAPWEILPHAPNAKIDFIDLSLPF